MGMAVDMRNQMAKRAAEEIQTGMVVNLGIGIPSLVPNHLSTETNVMFHAENGITGMGPTPVKGEEDENLCNAGGFPVTLNKGGSYCDSGISFGMIRRGRVDITILGSLEVSKKGDLANWIVPGKKVPGMGGAMELAQKAKKVIVVMNHCDKQGRPKIVTSCTLPLTSSACVDLIITDLAVFSVSEEGLLLTELFAPYSLETVVNKTGCEFKIRETVRMIPY
ncbi:3-oxoacid CoA-transferase subunit B [Neobacillus sp. C211]|uniref:3-oxoacid CoA-transferase subunit B n=1 Tax=Bacillaceae TaxID=186817 RepID=UPI001BE5F618|nr:MULTISPECIES: 3-oxoacid CoA-transferase subunit B [unclassified Bacillus (in: firmicutes)]MBT2699291.1 CoA transferase subunit B [Bacillus sp. ISL-40]MBT2723441.1 CoA transferase subunit B [Bacillus sp. ISL-46]MBT2737084.1 CoA transferase subunit B [Bacillus sp. ISL-7]MBT2739849.1 CoA transferase subunit B [Bacillus sp. ISL-77]